MKHDVSTDMPPGTYLLGDPAYTTYRLYKPNPNTPVFHIWGRKVLWFWTSYGDGSYLGSDGNLYGVDSGSLGLVPSEVATGNILAAEVTFAEPFTCWTDYANDVLHFGHISIDVS